jgi:hypothetical protein
MGKPQKMIMIKKNYYNVERKQDCLHGSFYVCNEKMDCNNAITDVIL